MLKLDRATFKRLLGPVENILRSNMEVGHCCMSEFVCLPCSYSCGVRSCTQGTSPKSSQPTSQRPLMTRMKF